MVPLLTVLVMLLANVITGNGLNNSITGGGGADTLSG
jgi:hypothetical protein